MTDLTKTTLLVEDLMQIEADARQMRAAVIAQAFVTLRNKIVNLLSPTGVTVRS
jgi:hypothetical protein